MPRSGSKRVASAHRSRCCAATARSPSNPSARVSTRLTLPSRIATRSPKQNAAIAAAVERPMPGSWASASLLAGKRPPCSATTAWAQRRRFVAGRQVERQQIDVEGILRRVLLAQRRAQLQHPRQDLVQALVLHLDLADALLEFAGRVLDALQRLVAAAKAAPAFAQLRIDLGRRTLA